MAWETTQVVFEGARYKGYIEFNGYTVSLYKADGQWWKWIGDASCRGGKIKWWNDEVKLGLARENLKRLKDALNIAIKDTWNGRMKTNYNRP